MQSSYSAQYKHLWQNHWWWQIRRQLVLQTIAKLLADRRPDESRPVLLDIGCAGGIGFDDLEKFGDPYGIEPDPQLIDPESRWSARIEQTFFDRDFVAARQFDLILMLDVLEHIEDDVGAVENLYTLLKPGGHAIITVPALPSLWSLHDEVNHHFRRYTLPVLQDRLTGAGWEVVSIRYFFSWSLGLLYLRKWLARGRREDYAVRIPAAPINTACRRISAVEEALLRSLRMTSPLGSSILAVARRPVK